MSPLTVRVARGLAGAWAAFWLLFFVLESLAWRTPLPVMLLWTGVGVLFVALVLVACWFEGPGGRLLIVTGLTVGVAYAVWAPASLTPTTRTLGTIVFGVPPLVAGWLLIRHHRLVVAAR